MTDRESLARMSETEFNAKFDEYLCAWLCNRGELSELRCQQMAAWAAAHDFAASSGREDRAPQAVAIGSVANGANACIPSPSSAGDAAADTARLDAMVKEMAKQASLGHKRFCVGVHQYNFGNGYGGEEWEWIDWSEAFARLLARASAPEPR